MKRVSIVQSFDGHPIGSVVELSPEAAESAVIQRRGVILTDDMPQPEPEPKPEPEPEPAQEKPKRQKRK